MKLCVLAVASILGIGCATPLSNTREFDQRQSVTFISEPTVHAESYAMAAQAAAFVVKRLIEWEGSKYTATSEARGDIRIDGITVGTTPDMTRGGLLIYIRAVTPDLPKGTWSRIGGWFKTLDRPDIDDLPMLDEDGIDSLVEELSAAECNTGKCFDARKTEPASIRTALDNFRISVASAVKKELKRKGRTLPAKELARYGTPRLTMLAITRVKPESPGVFRVNLVGTAYVALQAKNLPFGVPFTKWDETESKLEWTLIGPDGDPDYGDQHYAVSTLQKVEWDRDSARQRRAALRRFGSVRAAQSDAMKGADAQQKKDAAQAYDQTRKLVWGWTANERTSQLLTVPPFSGFRVETRLVESSDVTKQLNELAEKASSKLEAAGKD